MDAPEDDKHGGADLLALGFGSAVAMWAIGFVARMPAGPIQEQFLTAPEAADLAKAPWMPAPVLFALLLSCMLAGPFLTGKLTPRGWRGGLYTGLLCAALNLLVLLGLVSGGLKDNQKPYLVIPSFLLLGAVLGAVGGALGSKFRRACDIDWRRVLALCAVAATLLLISVGGLVTGFKSGLAVPDWPNTFGYTMFLYPLSKMSGGIYFEHSHRLLGTLVGLCVITLAIHTFLVDRRSWLRSVLVLAVLLVIVQGVLGGLRVTGRLTLSPDKAQMVPSTTLAIVHGIVAQVFFSLLLAISAFSSRSWRSPLPARPSASVSTDYALHWLLLGAMLIQLLLGAVVRHGRELLMFHIVGAVVALLLGFLSGVRAWGLYGAAHATLAKTGKALLWLVLLQAALGLAALHLLGLHLERSSHARLQVFLTTAHQTTGALLLATSLLLLLWTRRLVAPQPAPSTAGIPQKAA